MTADNIIIWVSSHNNYEMVRDEVLNVDFEGFEFVNVDDRSTDEQKDLGKSICSDNDIVYLQNKGSGVQWACQTLIDWIDENRPNCEWVICMQHDWQPLPNKNFFQRISDLISNNKLNEFGLIGFNVLDRGKYTKNSLRRYQDGEKPFGMLGLAHLGIASESGRWISPHHNDIANRNPDNFNKPFIIEMPMWAGVGICIDKWKRCIVPDGEYEFHLWLPDVAMCMNKNNYPCLILPDLYAINQQERKKKFGIPTKSTVGNEHFFGNYGNHLKRFKQKWKWDYKNARRTFSDVAGIYEGTLLYDYWKHAMADDLPLKIYDLGKY